MFDLFPPTDEDRDEFDRLEVAHAPVVGETFRYHHYFSSNRDHIDRFVTFTVAELASDRCCRDTRGEFWDFSTGGFRKVPR